MRRYGKKLAARIKEARADKNTTLTWSDEERNRISNLVHKDRENRYIIAHKIILISGKSSSCVVTELDYFHPSAHNTYIAQQTGDRNEEW